MKLEEICKLIEPIESECPISEEMIFMKSDDNNEVSDFIKQELAKQNEPLEMIYVGFSPHDCESLYKCPTCGNVCGSWDFVNGAITLTDGKFKCKVCKTILREPR